jgi:hypothetical protein
LPRRFWRPAIGLIAAIPAVVFYNKLNSDSERILGGYESFADELPPSCRASWTPEPWGRGRKRGGGGGGRRRRGKSAAMSEINVTPFVDVMLVLLIIFMVAAPMLTVGCRSNCRTRRRMHCRPNRKSR